MWWRTALIDSSTHELGSHPFFDCPQAVSTICHTLVLPTCIAFRLRVRENIFLPFIETGVTADKGQGIHRVKGIGMF